jgi:hypothetical protein
VDNPFSARWALRQAITTLGKDLYPGDLGVKWDPFHIICLLRNACRNNHPSWREALAELMEVLFRDHPDDVQAAQGREEKIRKMVPPPAQLVPGEPGVGAGGGVV